MIGSLVHRATGIGAAAALAFAILLGFVSCTAQTAPVSPQRLMEAAPELTWFADHGAHPGKHLALLNAILVHEAVLGSLPEPGPLVVSAPIYGSNTGLDATLRQARAPPPRADTPREVRYASESVLKILGTLDVDG